MGFSFPTQVTAEALQNFYKSRMPRVAGISLLSGLASDLIINAGHPSCSGEPTRCFDENKCYVQWSMIGSCWWEEVPYSEKLLLEMSC